MATPTKHSMMSPSSAHRFLNCTAAPRFEADFPNETSVYAEEGTLAHEVCEWSAKYNFNQVTKRKLNSEIKKLQKNELWQEEMVKTAEFYAQYLWEKALTFKEKPYMALEVRVDISEYIPEGFGTCDSVMIGGDTLHITDYKHGKGVPVSAENNPQMRLYALGALKKYALIYGEAIKKISMAIVQPRITEDVSEDCLTVEELLTWGEEIKPIALKAYSGEGEFKAGSWCKFCKGKAVCRARAENYTALEDFKGCLIEGKMSEEDKLAFDSQKVGPVPAVLSDAEIGDLLFRGKELAAWLKDIQEYALGAILQGKDIPGWKVVVGKSNRKFTDVDAAIEAIKKAGYEEKQLYKTEPKTLAQLESLLGKKDFAEVAGEFVTKPLGPPTLVTQDDKREPYNQAASDFAEAVNE